MGDLQRKCSQSIPHTHPDQGNATYPREYQRAYNKRRAARRRDSQPDMRLQVSSIAEWKDIDPLSRLCIAVFAQAIVDIKHHVFSATLDELCSMARSLHVQIRRDSIRRLARL